MARHSREQMMEIVREWQASGQSKKEFCQTKGISYATFTAWCRKVSSLPANTSAPKALQIVQVAAISLPLGRQADSGVHLEVGYVKVRLDVNFCPQTLARVLEVIKQC